ncbi:MAG: hypothetical protein COB08_009360 [Rhodobacteraceae bacterium]|nr:hypothetical protein [Paracoccaceae bacterium]
MNRIALILALTSTSAMAEITPRDVIESWRTAYAGMGATITYDAAELDGKLVQLNNVSSIEILGNDTTTSGFNWVRMQQQGDGSILVTFSPGGERTVITTGQYGISSTVTTRYDFSAMSMVATGYPSDIRYTYSAPQVIYSEVSGDESYGKKIDLILTDFSGEATSITNVTESGPRVADFGEFSFGRADITITESALTSPLQTTRILAVNAGMAYRVEFPLTDILAEPTVLTDMPARIDMQMSFSSGALSGQTESNYGFEFDPRLITFGHAGGSVNMRASHNQLSFGFSSQEGRLGMSDPSISGVEFDAAVSEANFEFSIPFRRSDTAKPFSLSLALKQLSLGAESWANMDPENAMGQPSADLVLSFTGLMRIINGVFEDKSELEHNDASFFVPNLSVDTARISIGDAVIDGRGNLRFNPRQIDPDTGRAAAKGELEFSIIGALGFLDRFGRLSGVDPMMILGAKGGLGMFASPTDTPDSFTSKIEFLSGGGIEVNGQTVR